MSDMRDVVNNFPKLQTEIQAEIRKERRRLSAYHQFESKSMQATKYLEENCFHKKQKPDSSQERKSKQAHAMREINESDPENVKKLKHQMSGSSLQ